MLCWEWVDLELNALLLNPHTQACKIKKQEMKPTEIESANAVNCGNVRHQGVGGEKHYLSLL